METQKELEKGIGTMEPERKTLKATKVKIVKVDIVPVGEKKNLKVVCQAEHPDADVPIGMSSVNYLKDKKVTNTGLWFNLDKEENIQKGSALATLMNHLGAKTLKELEGKEADTELEGNFLCFKAY